MSIYPFKDRVILQAYAWRQRLIRPHMLEFLDALRHPGGALICLPNEPDEVRQALTVVPDLITCLQAKWVTMVCSAPSAETCAALSTAVRVVPVGENDRKWTGLPTTELVSRVKGDGLRTAIDLHPRLDLLTAGLCRQTGARLRMCFQGPYSALFFNIQIAVAFEDAPAIPTNPYIRFLHTLKGIFGEKAEEIQGERQKKEGGREASQR